MTMRFCYYPLALASGLSKSPDEPGAVPRSLIGAVYSRLLNSGEEISVAAHNTHLKMQGKYRAKGCQRLYFRPEVRISEHQLEEIDDSSEDNVEGLIQAAERCIYKKNGVDYTEDFEKLLKELEKTFCEGGT